MLKIESLYVNTISSTYAGFSKDSVDVPATGILNGVSLHLETGQIYALMGRNGSGKSTLSHVIAGHPGYEISSGKISFEGAYISNLSPDERARKGIFLSFQHPPEIPGVKISSYLRIIYNNSRKEKMSPVKFRKILEPYLELLDLDKGYLSRYLNDGFSGGEKKKMEMLQMLVLEPKLVILDEVDSGLDVDAIKAVSNAVQHLSENNEATILLITHYSRILKYISPEKVFIMEDGRITREGSVDLAFEIEEMGYDSETK